MSGMMLLLIVWAVLTTILFGLIVYRVFLGNCEEDQLFLDRAEAALEREQLNVMKKIERVDPIIRWFSVASGVLLLVLGSWWIYQGLFTTPVAE